ncbi:MAG: histidine--tRNA ligase [Proteobacteria bacterium]|nr:histidine--tRNA ligase [Pseudomonadota bacterium]
MKKELIVPPRGMRDQLPAEVELRDWVVARILDTYRQFGFRHVETPSLEHIGLLTGSQAGENEKLIFKVLKRGEAGEAVTSAVSLDELVDLGLRFDLTVPLTRYYANNRAKLPRIFKAIQIGNVWRAERPQRGRFRQFTQCDIDVIGVESELAEAELIVATAAALMAIDLKGFTIRINDRGLLASMARLHGFPEEQHDAMFIVLDKFDKIGREGVAAELSAHGYSPDRVDAVFLMIDRLQELMADEETSSDPSPQGEPRTLFRRLRQIRDAVNAVANGEYCVEYDPKLVRGMGYYTGPVFEIGHKDVPFSIAGGGRYDKMIGRMIGEEVPACGFSIGFERIITVLQERKAAAGAPVKRLALIVDPAVALDAALAKSAELRAAGYAASLLPRDKKLGRQLQALAADGYEAFVVLKPDGGGAIERVEPIAAAG